MSPHAKLHRTVMALCFVVYIGFMVLMNSFTPDRPFSLTENRVLEPSPTFSLERLFSGQFTADFERYIADQFALRDAWIGVRSAAELALGKRENNGVFVAADASLIQAFSTPDTEDLQTKVEVINTFAAAFPDVKSYFMLIPNAVEILAEKLPRHAQVEDQASHLQRVCAGLDDRVQVVDVYPALYDHRDEYLYYRTDHHWTTQAAYYGYRKLAQEMGETALPKESFLVTPVTQEFYGTSQAKSGLRNLKPDAIELYIPKVGRELRVSYLDVDEAASDTPYSLGRLEGKDKYAVFLDGNHGLVKLSSNENTEKRLLVLKDSYANALVPFLTSHFGEIYVVDLRYYDGDLPDLITQSGITDLLMLYNLDTFCTDSSVLALADYAEEAVAKRATWAQLPGSNTGTYPDTFGSDLFIGDSISEGLAFYELLPEEVVAASKGLDFSSVQDDLELVRERKPKNVYVLLGINVIELSKDELVSRYAGLVRKLKEAAPQATIYIQSILPVEPWVGALKPEFDQEHIDECNAGLKAMAAEERVRFVNIAEVASVEMHEGDGIHFKPDFYPLWLDYLVKETKAPYLQGGS